MAGSGVIEGPLSKWTNVMKGWQYRWFVLDESSGLLSYYTVSTWFMKYLKNSCCFLFSAWLFWSHDFGSLVNSFMQWSGSIWVTSKVELGTGPLHIKCLLDFDSEKLNFTPEKISGICIGPCLSSIHFHSNNTINSMKSNQKFYLKRVHLQAVQT